MHDSSELLFIIGCVFSIIGGTLVLILLLAPWFNDYYTRYEDWVANCQANARRRRANRKRKKGTPS